jgi:hypothetical protein
MSKKTKPVPPDPKSVLKVEGNETDHDKFLAQTALRPTVQAAVTLQLWSKKFGQLDLSQLVLELRNQTNAANDGNLARGEAMLMAQAQTLDAIFNELARRAALNLGEYMNACELYLRLGLKAQSQCRATVETLAEMKNPRQVAFVRQANIANNQQVNNGTAVNPDPSRAGSSEIPPNKLLEVQHGNGLDFGTTTTSSDGNSQLETVGTINGRENKSR